MWRGKTPAPDAGQTLLQTEQLCCVQTAAMSVGVGTACTLYEPFVVLEALVLTASITLSLTAYTFYAARKGQSFQKLGPMLFTCAPPMPSVASCLGHVWQSGRRAVAACVCVPQHTRTPALACHDTSWLDRGCSAPHVRLGSCSISFCSSSVARILWHHRHDRVLPQVYGRSSPGPSSRSCSRCLRSARPSLRSSVRTCQRRSRASAHLACRRVVLTSCTARRGRALLPVHYLRALAHLVPAAAWGVHSGAPAAGRLPALRVPEGERCHDLAYAVQDTEQLISRHDLDDYVIASLSLYLDILNLFMKVRCLCAPLGFRMHPFRLC